MTMMGANDTRARLIKEGSEKGLPVVYWMSRDQRVRDNWALLFAQDMAMKQHVPLAVIFCLVPRFLNATVRHYHFMLTGLEAVDKGLSEKNIPLFLLIGAPDKEIPKFLRTHRVGTLVADFDPLRIKRTWKEDIAKKNDIGEIFSRISADTKSPGTMDGRKETYRLARREEVIRCGFFRRCGKLDKIRREGGI
jgi:deoxyribodipyrimidine photo-lyase